MVYRRNLYQGWRHRTYLYRAVDETGQTVEFLFSEKRDRCTARRFFAAAIERNVRPESETGANTATILKAGRFRNRDR